VSKLVIYALCPLRPRSGHGRILNQTPCLKERKACYNMLFLLSSLDLIVSISRNKPESSHNLVKRQTVYFFFLIYFIKLERMILLGLKK